MDNNATCARRQVPEVAIGNGRSALEDRKAGLERPVLFSAPMVAALLAGTKTQTRRLVSGAASDWAPVQPRVFSPTVLDRNGDEQPGPDAYGAGNEDGERWIRCPYGQPGDRLWVRECFSGPRYQDMHPPRNWHSSDEIHYWADGRPTFGDWTRPRPGIFMPRWASRLTLVVSSVRVERLQDISRADAIAEGCPHATIARGQDPRVWFEDLWSELNGNGSWQENPWVWVVAFRRELHVQGNREAPT